VDVLADRAWVQRNLGFDPISKPPPWAVSATAAAAKPGTLQKTCLQPA
jgi:hypothetical protein